MRLTVLTHISLSHGKTQYPQVNSHSRQFSYLVLVEGYFHAFQNKNNSDWSLIILLIQIGKFRISAWVAFDSLSCTGDDITVGTSDWSSLVRIKKKNFHFLFHCTIKEVCQKVLHLQQIQKQGVNMSYIDFIGIRRKYFLKRSRLFYVLLETLHYIFFK